MHVHMNHNITCCMLPNSIDLKFYALSLSKNHQEATPQQGCEFRNPN